jgi:hypothetical protein
MREAPAVTLKRSVTPRFMDATIARAARREQAGVAQDVSGAAVAHADDRLVLVHDAESELAFAWLQEGAPQLTTWTSSRRSPRGTVRDQRRTLTPGDRGTSRNSKRPLIAWLVEPFSTSFDVDLDVVARRQVAAQVDAVEDVGPAPGAC